MELIALPMVFTICQVPDLSKVTLDMPYLFFARTEEELSVVCPASSAPGNALALSSGWRCLKVKGPLDFSLVGILAELTTLLAKDGISLFAVSTFNTDYVLIQGNQWETAIQCLARGGHTVSQ